MSLRNSWLSKLSIRVRLTILYVLVFGGTHLGFSIINFNYLADNLEKAFDDDLFNYAVDVLESISLEPSGDLSFNTPSVDRGKLYPFALGTALIQIRHAGGDILTQVGSFGDLRLPLNRELDILHKGAEASFRTLRKLEDLPSREAETYRMITVPIDSSPQPQLLLQIAVPLTVLESQIADRKILLEILVPAALAVALLLGYYLSSRAMRPLQVMIQNAKEVSPSQLTHRLDVPAAKDELRDLALTLNEMLARIENAFKSQERFIADASHQLLTPLTVMRQALESAIKSPAESSKDFLQSCLQEVDQLANMVRGLLVLARVEAGNEALVRSPVYLDELAAEAIARVDKLAEQKSIALYFNIKNQTDKEDHHPQVLGEADLLREMIFNLLENAIKYSPPSSTVHTELIWHTDKQELSIMDEGPGIAQELLKSVFDRFSRGQNVSQKGHGLGLAIAKKIAEAHGAQLQILPLPNKGTKLHFEIKNI